MLDFLHLPPWLLAQLTRWLDWLRAPLHTGPLDDVNPVDFWHGVLMGTAGAVLVPVAVLAARYWKIVPGQDWPRIINHRGWQRVHGLCGVAAVLCLVAGVAMAFQGMSLASHLAHPHAWMGWGVMAVLLLLVVNIALRGSIGGPGRHQPRTLVHLHDVPGDHYDMTRRRRIFEHGHRWLGYGLMLALFANVMTGYWHVNVPRGLALATLAWWACLALMAGCRWLPGALGPQHGASGQPHSPPGRRPASLYRRGIPPPLLGRPGHAPPAETHHPPPAFRSAGGSTTKARSVGTTGNVHGDAGVRA